MSEAQTRQLWRVHWRSNVTGATGHGTAGFPRAMAEDYCRQLDRECPGLAHWIEPESPKPPEPTNDT